MMRRTKTELDETQAELTGALSALAARDVEAARLRRELSKVEGQLVGMRQTCELVHKQDELLDEASMALKALRRPTTIARLQPEEEDERVDYSTNSFGSESSAIL